MTTKRATLDFTPIQHANDNGGDIKEAVTVKMNAAAHKQIKIIAAQESMTIQAVIAEALNTYFVSRGLPELA